jgi:hypothetical protein
MWYTVIRRMRQGLALASSLVVVMVVLLVGGGLVDAQSSGSQNPQSGSTGLQGRISAPPPTQGATISIPRDGQTFTTLPITVSGLCPGDLLVKLFKNNVFAGATQCKNGSYSLVIDLFNGRNELIARVYDSLDQAGPDSNMVAVTYADSRPGTPSRVSLTSNYAKRGANPGQVLTWPITLSGGEGPYAISVDWGDGKAADLISRTFAGNFDIQHVYDSPGVYNIIVKATDKNGSVAFLQLVGVGNGALKQDTGDSSGSGTIATKTNTVILWQPAAILIPLILFTFWLGKKHEFSVLRKKVRNGELPF